MLEEQQTPFQMRLQNNIICDPNVETAMNHFSLITHGFGMINQSTWSRAFENFAKHSLSLYLQHHPHSQIINA
uniref:TF_AP-2 domain-containing protein n=1 Tax=Heterorhabditis bacteriophora TaxID=37862 RepID=A0A1I7XH34_HETBA